MEHRSYMSRTGRSSLLLSLLVSAIVFSPPIQAENIDEYGENIEHEIIIISEHHHQNDAALPAGRHVQERSKGVLLVGVSLDRN